MLAVGGTIVCTLLGAVLFARGVAQVSALNCPAPYVPIPADITYCTDAYVLLQNNSTDAQSREQVVAKRRRIKPVKKAEQATSAEQGDTADS